MLKFTIDGVPLLIRKGQRAVTIIDRGAATSVEGTCRRITTKAQGFVPVLSGDLKSAIGYTTRGTIGWVGVEHLPPRGPGKVGPERYWRYVEFGTVHAPARPFFTPAAAGEEAAFVSRTGTTISGGLEREL